jgi:hypothetical protein
VKSPSRLLAISVAVACLTACVAASAAQAAGSPAWAPIAASGPTNLPPVQSEVQRLSVDAEGGTFTLTFDAQTTGPIAFDADASQVEAELNALSTIGAAGASVTVNGGPGDGGATSPYLVSFGGSLADIDVAELSADSGALTGGDNHVVLVSTAVPGGPGTTEIAIYAQNVGGAPSTGTPEIAVTLPPGVTTSATPGGFGFFAPWKCTPTGAGQSSVNCQKGLDLASPQAGPGFTLKPLIVPVVAAPGAASGMVHVTVSGGGAVGTAQHDMPLVVSAISAPPGLQAFNAATYDENGVVDTRAGAHPFSASAGVMVNTVRSAKTGQVVPVGELRDIVVDTPPGFIGNPIATEQCPEALDQPGPSVPPERECGHGSMVATSQVPLIFGSWGEFATVNNIEAPFGFPAKFRFLTGSKQVVVNVAASLRSDEDYGLEVGSYNTPQIKPVFGSFFTIWGTPADAGHDGQRCKEFNNLGTASECGPGGENVAFLTNAVDCSEEALRPPVATINVNLWQSPGLFFSHDLTLKPVEGCDELEFDADFTFEPSETKSDSPASFRTELTVPSAGLLDPDKRMTPTIKETVVDLPRGVVLNASAADGLAACSEQQIGLKGTDFPAPNHIRFSKDPQTCPDASKIGTGELKSELIEEPLHGALYLAAQGEGNPFGSLFAIYLVIEDPRHGIFIKLPGEVQVNEADGQQRIVFRDLPPLPFSYLKLSLKGGNRSPLASPTTCGTYTTTATNTPWSAPESGPPAVSPNSFEIDQGPNGLPCAPTRQDRPFDVGLDAGTDSAAAGARTPLTFQLTRPDGSQEIDSLELSTAPGISASLKGIPQCSAEAIAAASAKSGREEQASPSCPAASQIGRLLTGAGSGATPFYARGKLYLSGPYRGAPLSVVAITPAVAGPFDLGNVVVRSAVFIDRSTARVTAKADPIPQILKGVPLRIRDIRVVLDREGFTLNPTSCDASAISARVGGNSGASKDLSARFQVGGCGGLAFKPSFWAKVKGATKRGGHPKLIAKVRWPEGPGFANTKDVQVTLPRSEFLDQAHIRTICTRVQAVADQCPAGSIYGFAEATTPLLDGKLTGPVFLKSSDHDLPDLAIKLRGPDSQPVEVEFAGRIDSIKGQIRNTIKGLPDVPVSSFTLRMKGGKRGLLVNSRNLCTTREARMDVRMVAQNNRRADRRPVLRSSCRKAGHHKRHRKSTRGRR